MLHFISKKKKMIISNENLTTNQETEKFCFVFKQSWCDNQICAEYIHKMQTYYLQF